MSRRIYILLAMFIVLCGTALPAHAQQSAQEILSSLNTTLESVSYSTQNPRNSSIENWNNSYQFAVIDNRFIITYRLDVTFFKGEEMQDKYFETGTYSAPLDLLTSASVSPFSQTLGIAIICNDKEKCFTQESSGQYEHKGKIAQNKYSKSSHRINLNLPEDLIGPTIDLLQDLLYP
jgi:hypothetical protein